MGEYSHNLPQLHGQPFLTDGGLETTLVFCDNIDLPCFAAFTLLRDQAGRQRLNDYFQRYFAIAKRAGTGFVLESATWRANPDWAAKIGYIGDELDRKNREAIALLHSIREAANYTEPMVISGCVGPRDDGYHPASVMSAGEAAAYHTVQIASFNNAGVDMVSAVTMTNVPEAVGIARAAAAVGLPVVISFTVETDGRLPTGDTLHRAIEETDRQTDGAPAYYMINCAHPTHFVHAFTGGEWLLRIRGLRANASELSHAELDEAEELDDGDPQELAQQYRAILDEYPHINVLGGCCGTDHRHVEAIAAACIR